MKNLLKVSLLLIVISSCVDEGISTKTIKGRLLNNCDEQKPVANQSLYFYVDYDTPEDERYAYTDEQGYFEYSFNGPAQSESVLGGTIRVSESKIILAGVGSFGKEVDAGTLYLETPKHGQITFKINGKGYTSDDSLYISQAWPVTFPRIKMAGPFDNVKTDTIWMRYATTAQGSMENYTTMNQPSVRRLNGDYGSICYWEIRRNGQLMKEGRDEVTFGACAIEAVMIVNLNE